MLTFLFQSIRNLQQFFSCNFTIRNNICHFRFPVGNRSCLIQRHDLNFSGLFQRNRCFKHNTVFCTFSASDHDRYRSGKTKRTWTANHQNSNSSCKRKSHTLSCQHPYGNGNDRNHDYNRNKDSGYFVCNFCNRRLGCCCITDHLDNLGQCRVLSHTGCLTTDIPRLIECRSRNNVSCFFVYRNTFSCKRRFINRTASFQHNTIHGYMLTRANHKHIPFSHLLDGNCLFLPVPDHNRRLWRQAHQAF